MRLTKRSLIFAFTAAFAVCGGVLVAALYPSGVAEAAAHLDISDMLFSAVLIAFGAASASYSA